MSIKILTKNSIDNTNIDGARANHFSAGMRSGIVKGAYNEGRLFTPASNKIALDSCELRISGHQVIIDSVEQIELQNAPSQPTRMSVIAEIKVDDSSVPTFRLFVQNQNVALIQDNLFKTNNGNGTYQLRIGNFTLGTTGLISDVVRTADIITGGAGGGVADIKFNATATQLSSSSQPDVNIDYNEETGEYDAHFGIPAGGGSRVTIGGVEQPTWSADPVYQLSNPNLLINGDFRVNQRGQTSYTTNAKYTVDRWLLSYGSLVVNSDGSVTHTASNTWQGIRQIIEFPSRLAGKTITFSMKSSTTGATKLAKLAYIKSGATSAVEIGDSGDVAGSQEITIFTATIPSDITDDDKLYILLYTPQTNQSITYYWAKLEIGSVATAFSPRPYAEELALCQRYYWRLNFDFNTTLPYAVARNTTTLSFNFALPTKLRTVPTLTQSGTIKMLNSPSTTTLPNFVLNNYNDGWVRLFITTTGITEGGAYVFAGENTGYISLDAEMY